MNQSLNFENILIVFNGAGISCKVSAFHEHADKPTMEWENDFEQCNAGKGI
jgi:hypothetical protein